MERDTEITNAVGELKHCSFCRAICMAREISADLFEAGAPDVDLFKYYYETHSTKMGILIDYLCKAEAEIERLNDMVQ